MTPLPAIDRRRRPDGLSLGTFTTRDGWPLRRFDFPADGAARGSLLFLGGRGDFFEKYLDAFHHWHGEGWSISGFDWRGQGGSGRFLSDRTICHVESFDLLLSDLSAFAEEWRQTTLGPHVMVGHSMGGHLALRYLVAHDAGIDAAVLSSPMLGIRIGRLPAAPLQAAAEIACALGWQERLVWRKDPGNVPGRMTSCAERIDDKIWWKSKHPEIALGGPSWGWTRAAFASLRALDSAALEAVATPLLILGSTRDPIVRIDAMEAAAQRLPKAQLALWREGGHELLREADGLRHGIFERIDRFLAAVPD